MKIVLATVGSRGDIQPYIALGAELKKNGEDTVIVTHPWAEELVLSYGLKFIPAGNDIDIHEEARRFAENPQGTLQGIRYALTFIFDQLKACHQDFINNFKDADLIIGHGITGRAEADILKKPFVQVSIETMGLERVYWKSGNLFKELGIFLSDALGKKVFGGPYIRYRKEIGAPPVENSTEFPHLSLIPMTPLLIKNHSNWKPVTEITGFFFADTPADYEPPEEVMHFLSHSDKPIFITFGSMFHRKDDARMLFSLISRSTEEAGIRALVLMADVDSDSVDVPEQLLMVKNVPYHWLLPQVKFAVHHFGFGTAAEVLRAGVPSVPIPHLFDQKIRSKQFHRMGFCTKPLDIRNINSKKFAAVLKQVGDNSGMIARCAEAGEVIRKENGVQKASGLIQKYFK